MLATVRTRSRPFAHTRCLQRLHVGRANASEPEGTLSAAIAAIVIVATFNVLARWRDRSLPTPLTSRLGR
jgi:hypothetical protein